MGLFLERIRRRADTPVDGAFPWTVPALATLDELRFRSPVTFLMGENGAGKSTLLEAVALLVDAAAVGAEHVSDDATLAGAARFAAAFRAARSGQPRARMFFRAEDSFGFTRRVEREMRDFEAEADRLLNAEGGTPQARRRAAAAVRGQSGALASRYGHDPHAFSHGETFLQILRQRLAPGGLYLLDEPETPLSPARVLALLVLLNDGVRAGSQFIVATHSPILSAFPGAEILLFDHAGIRRTKHEDLEHVQITRDFLAAPERYLRRLFSVSEEE